MKEIPLTQGKVAIVDDQDYEWLSQYRCHASRHRNIFYARVYESGRVTYMHRLILCAPQNLQIDHKNGNGLDNRRENLRFATHSQNVWNRPPSRSNTSGYKGVSFDRGIWRARIRFHYERFELGRFDSLEDALSAYADAARHFHGDFMHT